MPVEFQFEFEKAQAALLYFCSRDVAALDKYKICKLLFLADKYHLVKYGRPITGDKYCALAYGPIPSHTLDILNEVISGQFTSDCAAELNKHVTLDRHYVNPRFAATSAYDASQLSQSDVMALDHVVVTFGRMGFDQLKAITHEMFAYKRAWSEKPEDRSAGDMRFEEFFEQDSDAVAGAQDEMVEDDILRKVFATSSPS